MQSTRVLVVVLSLACWNRRQSAEAQSLPPAGQVARTLSAYNAAVAAPDTGALRPLVTPNFVLVDGESKHDLIGIQISALGVLMVGRIARTLDSIHTRFNGDSAFAEYRVGTRLSSGSFANESFHRERAILLHSKQGWRIAFIEIVRP